MKIINSFYTLILASSLSLISLEAGDISFSTSSERYDEGIGMASILISLSEAQNTPVSVRYLTSSRDALGDVDFEQTEGILTFEPGEVSKVVEVKIIEDEIHESSEWFDFKLMDFDDPTRLLNSMTAIQAILDNDEAPRIKAENVTVIEPSEGETQALVVFKIQNNPSSREIRIQYETESGSANESDFESVSGEVIIPPGELEVEVNITVHSDEIIEGSEYFDLRITQIGHGYLPFESVHYPYFSPRITIQDPQSDWSQVEWNVASGNINSLFPMDVSIGAVNKDGEPVEMISGPFELYLVPEISKNELLFTGIYLRDYLYPAGGANAQITNTGVDSLDLKGWSVVFYDRESFPYPKGVYTITGEQSILETQSTLTFAAIPSHLPLNNSYPRPAIDVGFNCVWSYPKNWAFQKFTEPLFVGVVLLTPFGEVQDSFFSNIDPEIGLLGPNGMGMNGFDDFVYDYNSLDYASTLNLSAQIYRQGTQDNNQSEDWSSLGTVKLRDSISVAKDLELPWSQRDLSVRKLFTSDGTDILENGWSGSIHLDGFEGNFYLEARFESGQVFSSAKLSSVPKAFFQIEAPQVLTEPGTPELGESAGLVEVTLDTTFPQDLEVQIETSLSDQISIPETILIPAGNLNASFEIEALDNEIVDAVREVIITLIHPMLGKLDFVVEVWDNEPNGLEIVASTPQENRYLNLYTYLQRPLDRAARISLTHNLENTFHLPDAIEFEAGETEKRIVVEPKNDHLLNVNREQSWIELSSGHWLSDRLEFELKDATEIRINLRNAPTVLLEGKAYTLEMSLTFNGSGLDQESTLMISNPDPERFQMPEFLTVPAETWIVQVPVAVIDNELADGNSNVTFGFEIEGFEQYRNAFEFEIRDDDFPTPTFHPIPSRTFTGLTIPLVVAVENVDQSPILGVESSVDNIQLKTSSGVAIEYEIQPANTFSTKLIDGIWKGELRVFTETEDDLWLELLTDEQEVIRSNGFRVYPLARKNITLNAVDAVFARDLNQIILATSPDDPNYPNQLVVMDSESLEIVDQFGLPEDFSTSGSYSFIELSPDQKWLYAIRTIQGSQNNEFAVFDLQDDFNSVFYGQPQHAIGRVYFPLESETPSAFFLSNYKHQSNHSLTELNNGTLNPIDVGSQNIEIVSYNPFQDDWAGIITNFNVTPGERTVARYHIQNDELIKIQDSGFLTLENISGGSPYAVIQDYLVGRDYLMHASIDGRIGERVEPNQYSGVSLKFDHPSGLFPNHYNQLNSVGPDEWLMMRYDSKSALPETFTQNPFEKFQSKVNGNSGSYVKVIRLGSSGILAWKQNGMEWVDSPIFEERSVEDGDLEIWAEQLDPNILLNSEFEIQIGLNFTNDTLPANGRFVFRLPEWVKYSVVGADNLVVERQGNLTQIVLPSQLSGETFSVTLKCKSSQAGSFPLMTRITAANDIQTDYVNESIFYFQTLLPETISEPVKFQSYFKEAFTQVYQDKWLGISTKPASHMDIPWLNPFPGHLVEIDLKNGSTKSLLELDESLNRIYFDRGKDQIVAYSNHATSLGLVRNYIGGDPELVGFWDWSNSAELEGFTVMGAIPDPYFNNRIIIALTQFSKERMGDYEFKILVWNINTERFLPMKIELDNASIRNSGLDFYQRVRLIPSPVQNRILVINKFDTYSSIVYYKLSLQGLEKVDQTFQINGSIAEFPDMDYQPKGDRVYWYNGMVFNLETNTQEEELWPELVDSIFNTEYFLLAPTETETFSLVSNYYNPNFPDNIVESEIAISFRNFHDGSIIKELEMDFPFNKINEPFFIPDLGFVMHLVDGSGVFLFGPEYLDRVVPIISDLYLNLASGADGSWFLEFLPQPGFQYQIQSSSNLAPNSWDPLSDSISGDSPVQVPVQLMENQMRYFRLRREE